VHRLPCEREDELSDETEPGFATRDEAIAAALAELEPGGTLAVHADECEMVDDEDQCTCTPMLIQVGGAEA
jgi:hypothetical protein